MACRDAAGRPQNRQRSRRGGLHLYLYSFCNLGARLGSVLNATLRPLYHPGHKPGTQRTGRWVGPKGRSERVREISPSPPGFDLRTFQPAASRISPYPCYKAKLAFSLPLGIRKPGASDLFLSQWSVHLFRHLLVGFFQHGLLLPGHVSTLLLTSLCVTPRCN
jgi:hypothetical protein